MKKLLVIIFITIIPVFLSCDSAKNKRVTINYSQPSKVLEGAVFPSLEPLTNISKLLTVDDYLILYCKTDSNFFKVFRLPELKYLYSFGKIGGVQSGYFINPDRNSMRIIDNSLVFLDVNRVISIKIAEDKWNINYEKPTYNRGEYLDNFQLLNDSVYLTSKMNRKLEFQMIDLNTGKLIKEFGNYPEEHKPQPERNPPLSYFKSTAIRPDKKTIASFYLYSDMFKIYDNGILDRDVYILNNKTEAQDNVSNEHNNVIYRVEATATDNAIYTLGLKLTEDVLTTGDKKFTPRLEVWDWKGKSLKTYSLNMPITLFCFSEKYNTIYGLHHNDIKELVRFNLPK